MSQNNTLINECINTEVGFIPKHWKVKSFESLFDFSGGFSASRDQLSNSGFCYLHYGDIHMTDKTYIDVDTEILDIPKLNIELKKISKQSLLNDGDIVFVDASEDDDGVSKHIVVRNAKGIKYISGLHTIVAKSKNNELDNLYKQFCFKTSNIKKQFKFYAVGTKVSGVSKSNIKKILMPIPSKEEQKAIATALSDIDDLILSLEKLISKKKMIKEGTMEELLTGKKRLDGFNEEWVKYKLGEIAEVATGSTPSTNDSKNYGDKYMFVSPIDLGKQKYIISTEKMLSQKGFSISRKYPAGSILFTCIGSTIGKSGIAIKELSSNQQINAIFPNSSYVTDFMYYMLNYLAPSIKASASEQAVPIINKSSFEKIELNFPKHKEQEVIANILSAMDNEIEKLEKKLNKYKNIKTGMMEELLTGKRRLV